MYTSHSSRRAALTIQELATKYGITDPGQDVTRFIDQAEQVCRHCFVWKGNVEFGDSGRGRISPRYMLSGIDSKREEFLVTGDSPLDCLTSAARELARRYAMWKQRERDLGQAA